MKKNVEIMIDEKVDHHLNLKESAIEFFRELNNELNCNPEENIDVLINFQNIIFISHSFAQEYNKQKNKFYTNIIEKKVPENIKAVFENVSKHDD